MAMAMPMATTTDMQNVQRARARNPKRRIFDWISEPRPENITPFQQFILDVEWEKSPLGPMRGWPAQLRQMVLLVVQDPSPAVVYWGDEATIVYNESYTDLIGEKHPALQGADPKIEFAEIWSHFEALLSKQRETAETVVEANAFLLLFRHGFFEETYFSWKFVPIIGDDGWVVGSHATVVEVTREVIADRRLNIVSNVSMKLSSARSIKDLWSRLLTGLEDAGKDIPLAILYSVADSLVALQSRASSKSPTRSPRGSLRRTVSTPVCLLEGTIGIPHGHPAAPETIDLNSKSGLCVATAMREAFYKREPYLAPVTGSVMEEFRDIAWRGHSVPPTQLIACPIIPNDSENVMGFLVLALNPRRPYDEDHRSFLQLLTRQVTQPQLSAVILREEVERRQSLARQEALDRARLTRELSDSETKFARFASRAPIGLAILTPDGHALSANPLWQDLTKLDVGTSAIDWSNVLAEGQVEPVMEAWGRLMTDREPITIQTRMKRQWRAPDLDMDGKEQWTESHILLAMYPDTDDNGVVFSVMSCITDVSELKWNEIQLRRKMDQAIEMKKQQERFIDMTSHEMRNPLSALIGCADEIIASITDYRSLQLHLHTHPSRSVSGATTPYTYSRAASASNSSTNLNALTSASSTTTHTQTQNQECDHEHNIHPQDPAQHLHLLDEALEAADTIIYCAMHQKRIIDDILTLSRLDSNLLLVSPSPTQPLPLIRSALKMFDAELKRAATTLTFIEDESLRELDLDWTLLDPSRVLQVLINLMTNAIKFTRTERRREITVSMSASLTRPSESQHNSLASSKLSPSLSPTTTTTNLPQTPIQWVLPPSSSSALPLPSADQTTRSEWGSGAPLYLLISVSDTGRGLTPPEIQNLFHLFAQASPKTHQTYGGSGLGLFISRQLVNMQGGEIGVQSVAGEGSRFVFYVKTRRTTADEGSDEGVGENESAVGMSPGRAERAKLSRGRSVHGHSTSGQNIELLVREDALREACAVEISAPQNGGTMPNFQPEEGPPPSPSQPTSSHNPHSHSQPAQEASKTAAGVAPSRTLRNPPKKTFHILVVEDNLVNQKVVTKQLRKSGHVVSVANHGEEALEFIRRSEFWACDGLVALPGSSFSASHHLTNGGRVDGDETTSIHGSGAESGGDGHGAGTGAGTTDRETASLRHPPEKLHVVLMDLEMPVMDGLTCVRRIRELQSEGKIRAHIPVIAVTANARKDQIMNSLDAGMDDVTTKPYRMTDMLKQIEKLVARHTTIAAHL